MNIMDNWLLGAIIFICERGRNNKDDFEDEGLNGNGIGVGQKSVEYLMRVAFYRTINAADQPVDAVHLVGPLSLTHGKHVDA